MLGITTTEGKEWGFREDELPAPRFGKVCVGHDEGGGYYSAVIARWAYMNYQVKSFVTELIENGFVEFQGGYADGVIRPTQPNANSHIETK